LAKISGFWRKSQDSSRNPGGFWRKSPDSSENLRIPVKISGFQPESRRILAESSGFQLESRRDSGWSALDVAAPSNCVKQGTVSGSGWDASSKARPVKI